MRARGVARRDAGNTVRLCLITPDESATLGTVGWSFVALIRLMKLNGCLACGASEAV